ncbi:hypothetical protein D0B32_28855 [Paraburkholderia sp. DHOC27]|nr:hypothetical protein D0B32_28855 [Paraburkholderia sp. DHOC27]
MHGRVTRRCHGPKNPSVVKPGRRGVVWTRYDLLHPGTRRHHQPGIRRLFGGMPSPAGAIV